ncbi:hypothetical protein ACFX12_011050 [Malus domestica]
MSMRNASRSFVSSILAAASATVTLGFFGFLGLDFFASSVFTFCAAASSSLLSPSSSSDLSFDLAGATSSRSTLAL